MNKKVEVKLNTAAVGKLLRSNEVKEACINQASKIRNKCGEGYKTGSYMGTDRVKATVYPVTIKAKRSNLENNTLLKAMM